MVISGRPPGIGRVPAQRLARRELARSIYRPSWLSRAASAVIQWLNRLFNGHGHVPAGGVAVVVGLAVAVLALAAWWAGPARRSGRLKAAAVLGDRPLSAAEHRRAADRLAAAGDFAAAIIERVRAMAVDLEQRGILPPGPGRTAAELAAQTAAALPPGAVPDAPARLDATARLFDDIRYGGRAASQAGYEQVRDLDEAIRSARVASVALTLASAGSQGPGAW